MNMIPISSNQSDVLGDESQIGHAVAEQAGREQRLFARSLEETNLEEEPEQKRRAQRAEDDQQRVVVTRSTKRPRPALAWP